MKKPSDRVRTLVSILSVVVIVLSYSGVSTPELVQNVLADVLVVTFLS